MLVIDIGTYFVNTTNDIVYLFIVLFYILFLFTLHIFVLISIIIILMCLINCIWIANLITGI